MITTINNDLRVYQITTTYRQFFCNIQDLNAICNDLDAGRFTIYHFYFSKPKKVSKKDLKLFFEGAELVQEFIY